MYRLILLVLVIINLPLWADQSKSYFCSESANIQQKALNQDNELAFTNPSGMKLGIIGTILGYEEGIGACWWHSKMQRAGLYLAMFRPELPPPTQEEAIALIQRFRLSNEVIEIPGYSNLREFSTAWASEFEEEITQWQTENTWAGQWTKGLDARFNRKLNPDQLKELMEQLYARISRGEVVFQRLPYRDAMVVHSWLVIKMVRIEEGFRLTVIDSNQTDRFPVGSSGHYEVDYFYGDRYISYRGDQIVPQFEANESDVNQLKQIRNAYCKGVETFELVQEESNDGLFGDVSAEELTDEQAGNLLYNFLTVSDISYPQVIYVVSSLRSKQEMIINYFNHIASVNEDFHPQISYRIVYLISQYSPMRFQLEETLHKIVMMPSTTADIAGLIVHLLIGGGEFTAHAGAMIKTIFESYDLEESYYGSLIYALSRSDEVIDYRDYIFNKLLDSKLEYDEHQLALLGKAIINQKASGSLLSQVLKYPNVGAVTLQHMAQAIIDSRFAAGSYFLKKIIAHDLCDDDVLLLIVGRLERQWPKFENSNVILEEIEKHKLGDAALGAVIKKCEETLEQRQMVQNVLDQLDLSTVVPRSMLTYSCDARVTIDSTELSVENQSFKVMIGCENPMAIRVNFLNLHQLGKVRKLKIDIEAPAHFNYSTEKEIFELIFRCGRTGGCSERISGAIIIKEDYIEIYDTSGTDRNQLHIKGSR